MVKWFSILSYIWQFSHEVVLTGTEEFCIQLSYNQPHQFFVFTPSWLRVMPWLEQHLMVTSFFFRRNLSIPSGFGCEKISKYCGNLVAWGFKVGKVQPLPGNSTRMKSQKIRFLIYNLTNGAACGPSVSAAVRCGDTVRAVFSLFFSNLVWNHLKPWSSCREDATNPSTLSSLPTPGETPSELQFAPNSLIMLT